MLVELAIGDAYGAQYEFADPDLVAAHNDLQYATVREDTVPPGNYTDDTQQTIAIAELLVEGGDWTPKNIAQKFVDVYHRDPRAGYSRRVRSALHASTTGAEFLENIDPVSDTSGASMRACPLGIIADIPELIERTTIQAKISHNTPLGIQASIATALATHYCIYQLGEVADLGKFVASHVKGEWDSPYQEFVGQKGWMSVRAAFTAMKNHTNLADMLKACIAYTGDVDTVATIAMGASVHVAAIENNLPDHLYQQLEAGNYGLEYLQQLNEKWLKLKKS
ncbi:MAG TPA: ADP-ribosylglycohydrolase [Microscillaceae bacterium]|nr:ADP-ribosylglycohydrolase [Microscillaceae bacterium]